MNGALFGRLERSSDLILAFCVVALVGLLVVRVPAEALDVLIAVNIGVGLSVLLIALYIQDAMKLPSFPAILLLSTLFRLSLNVSTTRGILLEADAGRIIDAFGQFVVGGDFVVGAAIFIVLVTIQFVVIAKGSERVAEVAARFTLDAMAGKQASIDYDLNNNIITPDEARARRRLLERESKLYGAMDGAMKFVKGDAIAGILISLVNVIGGLVVGTRDGMGLGEAAETYTTLTIGDGLQSQIPALLISLAAGIVVTRVAQEEEKKSNLGLDLFRQVVGNPKALGIAAAMFLFLGVSDPLVGTGFPMLPFLCLSAFAAAMAFSSARRARIEEARREALAQAAKAAPGAEQEAARRSPPGLPPLVLEVGPGLSAFARAGADGVLQQMLSRAAAKASERLGVPVPRMWISSSVAVGDPVGYALRIWDARVGAGRLDLQRAFVPKDAEEVRRNGVDEAEPWLWPGRDVVGCLVPVAKALQAAGGESDDMFMMSYVVEDHLTRLLVDNAWRLIGIQEAFELLEPVHEAKSELYGAVFDDRYTIAEVTDVLRELVRERVPIRDLRGILESLARFQSDDRDPRALAEHVRRDLSEALCASLSDGFGCLSCYELDPALEARVADHAIYGALPPEDVEALVEAAREAIDPAEHLRRDPVVLVQSVAVRPLVQEALQDDVAGVMVLSKEDIPRNVRIEPIGALEEPAGAEPVEAGA